MKVLLAALMLTSFLAGCAGGVEPFDAVEAPRLEAGYAYAYDVQGRVQADAKVKQTGEPAEEEHVDESFGPIPLMAYQIISTRWSGAEAMYTALALIDGGPLEDLVENPFPSGRQPILIRQRDLHVLPAEVKEGTLRPDTVGALQTYLDFPLTPGKTWTNEGTGGHVQDTRVDAGVDKTGGRPLHPWGAPRSNWRVRRASTRPGRGAWPGGPRPAPSSAEPWTFALNMGRNRAPPRWKGPGMCSGRSRPWRPCRSERTEMQPTLRNLLPPTPGSSGRRRGCRGMAQTTQRPAPGLVNARIHPILATRDIARSRDFFVNTLGLKQAKFNEGNDAVYECDDGTTLYVYQRPDNTPSEATVCGFLVPDVEKAVQDLRARGVQFEEYDMPGLKTTNGIAQIGADRAAWFKDPDGNIIAVGQH